MGFGIMANSVSCIFFLVILSYFGIWLLFCAMKNCFANWFTCLGTSRKLPLYLSRRRMSWSFILGMQLYCLWPLPKLLICKYLSKTTLKFQNLGISLINKWMLRSSIRIDNPSLTISQQSSLGSQSWQPFSVDDSQIICQLDTCWWLLVPSSWANKLKTETLLF